MKAAAFSGLLQSGFETWITSASPARRLWTAVFVHLVDVFENHLDRYF